MTTFIFDPVHSYLTFSVRHIMISNARGHIANVKGWLEFDLAKWNLETLEARMDLVDLCTGNGKRDEHLRSADFFDAGKFPVITFQSKNIERLSAVDHSITGVLRMHGVEKEVVFDVQPLGVWEIPQKESDVTAPSIGFTGSLTIDRRDFGINWNNPLPDRGLGVGHDVSITLDIEAREKHADEECPVCTPS
ncbi:hypothetical protein COU77_02495 [Candidatus Peregrinibacteria bacterium CG10_big_fil_rev_8_21_14_0_10_49_16]|nr:MAG: hypothetical protein COW95_01035 [Candidatus Peregrinibacteria bacterium CG22_combo_CG10-13_8_21_14_all_49_11]PIR52042.1 MAG: hypothetical protein COU77_02495 [Candidatus Peregrinibacteria bacterium CG10_big_fil_rev_8_21_14_0_10_49_16]